MKKIGIWMDKEKAHVVVLGDEREKMHTVYSQLEFYNPKGGSGSKFKGGPQDVVQDSKYLARENQQLKTYFKKLVNVIEGTDALALFGPADTAEKFRKELHERYKSLAVKIKTVAKADSMTENQVKALVRDFYKTTT